MILKDFFFVCPGHVKDRKFCTPIIDEAAVAAKKKKEMEAEVERVKQEFEEKQKKKKEKEKQKEEKDKKDKDKKDDEKEDAKPEEKVPSFPWNLGKHDDLHPHRRNPKRSQSQKKSHESLLLQRCSISSGSKGREMPILPSGTVNAYKTQTSSHKYRKVFHDITRRHAA